MEEADDDLIRGEVERETLTSPSPRDVARRTHWGVGVESGWEKRDVVEQEQLGRVRGEVVV